MQLGGWWRLWIGLSAFWVAGALVLQIPSRPTAFSVSQEVGRVCGIATSMSEQYAHDALLMRKLLDELVVADAATDVTTARRLAKEIITLRELWSRNTGAPLRYSRFTVADPEGRNHTAIAPLHSSEEEVLAEVDKETRNANNWGSFSKYCLQQLQSHAKGQLRRVEMNNWITTLFLSALSLPLVLLLGGLFVTWVWRGFRPKGSTTRP